MVGGDVVVVAGASGDLGGRIVRALLGRGATVRALARPGSSGARIAGAERLEVDDDASLARAMAGAGCVVSAVNGLEPVVIGWQGRLQRAAVSAGVPRFIPSDYSLDFTRTPPGANRNLDLRRRFMATIDAAPIRATSVLNGGFLDLLAGGAPIVVRPARRVLHWGDATQTLDFTAKNDVADFTALAALDREAPRILRIAGDSVSPRDLARIMGEHTGQAFRTLRLGGIGGLSTTIRVLRAVAPGGDAVFPPWQGLQYLRDMMSGRGQLMPLDNNRYGSRTWTGAREVLAAQVQ